MYQNYSANPKWGFRYIQPAPHAPATAPINNAVGMDANAPPPVMDAPTVSHVDSTAPSREVSPALRQNVASSYGYTKGTQSPMNALSTIASAFIPGMGLLQGEDSESTFGQPGTYDAQGNVFGDDGVAYDPITGDVANYKDMGTWWDSKKSGYDSLREAGLNPIAAGLGDYSNSPHYISSELRRQGVTPANMAGIMDTMGRVRSNTLGEDIFNMIDGSSSISHPGRGFEGYNITPEMLGLDPNTISSTGTKALLENPQATFADVGSIGTWRAKPGQVVKTQDGSIGVVNDSGQIQTAQGTIVQTEGENLNDAGQATFIQPIDRPDPDASQINKWLTEDNPAPVTNQVVNTSNNEEKANSGGGTSWNDIVNEKQKEDDKWGGGDIAMWNKGGPVHAATGGYLGPPTQQGGMRRPDAGGKGGGLPQQPVVQQPTRHVDPKPPTEYFDRLQQPVQQQPVQQQPIIQQQPVQPAGGK